MNIKYVYHRDIGIPTRYRRPSGRKLLEYTYHAQQEAQRDRYGVIELPRVLDTDTAQLIELYIGEGDTPVKYVYRTRYNERFDLVLVVTANWRVIALWLNDKRDNHRTLNRAKYAKP